MFLLPFILKIHLSLLSSILSNVTVYAFQHGIWQVINSEWRMQLTELSAALSCKVVEYNAGILYLIIACLLLLLLLFKRRAQHLRSLLSGTLLGSGQWSLVADYIITESSGVEGFLNKRKTKGRLNSKPEYPLGVRIENSIILRFHLFPDQKSPYILRLEYMITESSRSPFRRRKFWFLLRCKIRNIIFFF